MRHSTRPMVIGAVALATVGLLAGCSSGGGSDATPTATTTRTVTATPTSGTTPSSASPTSAPSTGAGGGTSGTGSSGGSASGRCATDQLTGSIEPGGGGAAGSVDVLLALTNTGSASCTLQGWPGVSFVGGGNGTQIGAAATLEKGAPHPTVTLTPGQRAVAPLKIGQAANYAAADCGIRTPDGFRVYPPGSKQSLFIGETAYQACGQRSATLLDVQAFVPEGQATS